jgi:hypothetical protein
MAAAQLFYACLSHVPLWVHYPDYVTPIFLGEAQHDGALNLRELAPEWVRFHPQVGGTAGIFALRNHVLAHHPDVRSIGVCQYRKFVTRARISRVSAQSFRVMDVVHQSQFDADPAAELMLPDGEPFLFGRPRWFNNRRRSGSYLRQYGISHRSEDLLRFTAEAVSQGLLTGREVDDFFSEQLFVPGGIELGVYPADFWLRSVEAVEAVVRACVERYPAAPLGPQARAWSYCTERLGSWLLLRHLGATGTRRHGLSRLQSLRPSHWSRRFVGQLNLVTEQGRARYVPGT